MGKDIADGMADGMGDSMGDGGMEREVAFNPTAVAPTASSMPRRMHIATSARTDMSSSTDKMGGWTRAGAGGKFGGVRPPQPRLAHLAQVRQHSDAVCAPAAVRIAVIVTVTAASVVALSVRYRGRQRLRCYSPRSSPKT